MRKGSVAQGIRLRSPVLLCNNSKGQIIFRKIRANDLEIKYKIKY